MMTIEQRIAFAEADARAIAKYNPAVVNMGNYFLKPCQEAFMLIRENGRHVIVTKAQLGIDKIPPKTFHRANPNSNLHILCSEKRNVEFLASRGWDVLF
jgi:hypothetical protein